MAVTILVIGTAILVRGRRSAVASLFFAMTAAAAGWLLCFAMMYSAVDASRAMFWARLGHFSASLLAPAAFHFSVLQLGNRKQHRRIAWAVWIVSIIGAVLGASTPLAITELRHHPFGFYPAASLFSTFQFLVAAAVFTPSLILFWRVFKRGEGIVQERAGAMLLAYVLASLGLVDYLPSVGFEIYPVGYTAAFAFFTVTAGALWRYQLVDLTPEYASSQILETMKGAVLLADMEGVIRVANRATASMLGYKRASLIGRHIRDILHPGNDVNSGNLLNSFGILEQPMVWRTAAGKDLDVLVSSSFVRNADSLPMGIVYVAYDYTERKRDEEALRDSEHRYRTLFDLNPLPMWIYDFERLNFLAVNDAAVRHYGYSRREFLQMKITDIRPEEDVAEVLAILPFLPERVTPATFRHKTKDGRILDVDISSFEFYTAGRRARLVIAQDVTERRRGEQLLRESEARYRLLFERNLAGVYRSTADGTILDCNEACARIFGFQSRNEMIGCSSADLYFTAAEREKLVSSLRENRSLSNFECRMRRRDGSAVWVLENVTLLESGGGEADIVEGTLVDITDRKYAQEEMEYQAYHDVLTGLPNRLLFRDRISVALAHARRTARCVAIMFLDLDDFKQVNDSLGHSAGDRLLHAVGLRLVSAVRAEDTVARMGGDEFTVLLADIGDGRGAATVAQKILDTLAYPVVLDDHEFIVTASIGIALYPGDGFDAENLLKNADRAMYRAKQQGRNNYQYATPPPFDDRLTLERRLQAAVENEELVVHYQPIVEIATGTVVGAEALIRWNDPVRGLMSPDSFIPLAEESDLIITIGDWVLNTASKQMKIWQDEGNSSLRLAVNLSPRQFQQRDLAAKVGRILAETGLSPTSLELEITESTLMSNADLSLATIKGLKSMGVRISIDDFGTGYSSLSYLRRFPIDTLKIDQEFVRDVSDDLNDQAIVTAVVSMARALKLRVVAEGVETEAQLGFLQGEQCGEMQGFLYSKPVAAADFHESLRRAAAAARTLRIPSSN